MALRVVGTLVGHPLPAMLNAGLLATVNSDDPAYFGGYVDDNLAAVRTRLGTDDAQLAALARNSFDACFAPEADTPGSGRRRSTAGSQPAAPPWAALPATSPLARAR